MKGGDKEAPSGTECQRLSTRYDGNNQGQGSSRRSCKREVCFGDDDFTIESITARKKAEDKADWNDVFRRCCVRSTTEWRNAFVGIFLMMIWTYFYLFGLELLTAGSKVANGCRVGQFYNAQITNATNPLAIVMMGWLATVLMGQSSSTSTAIIVSLVASEIIDIEQATYLVMGANIGSTITNDIVALGMMKDTGSLERAFAGAIIHDLFNIFTVAILLPLEAISGYLQIISKLVVSSHETKTGQQYKGPVEVMVQPLVDQIIKSNTKAVIHVSAGNTCESLYPIQCDDGVIDYKSCQQVGFVGCSEDSGQCPVVFSQNADLKHDHKVGLVCIILGLLVIFTCIYALTIIIQRLLKGFPIHVVHKATNWNGYLNIVSTIALTMLLQSSSLTLSLLTPLVGIGILKVDQMFPLTLGANFGATLSSITMAVMLPGLDPLRVALIQLFFNLSGVLLWYPIPLLRRVIPHVAKRIAYCARVLRIFPVVYIVAVYFWVPIFILYMCNQYTNASTGFQLFGAILLTVVFAMIIAIVTYFCKYHGAKCEDFIMKHLTCEDDGHGPIERDYDSDDDSRYSDRPINTVIDESSDDSSSGSQASF